MAVDWEQLIESDHAMTKIRPAVDLERYAHHAEDPWRWRTAFGTDVQDIVDMALVDFGRETDGVFQNNTVEYSRNVTVAITNQFFNPLLELLSVSRARESDTLLGYTWARRGEYAPWSTEEMVSIRMAHIDQALSPRNRVKILAQMMRMWEVWAHACGIKIIASTTIRHSQDVFLDLHRAAGYSVRGSVAYKRLQNIKIDVEDTSDFRRNFIIPGGVGR